MNQKRWLLQMIGLISVALLLATCGAPEPTPTPTPIPPTPTATSTPMPTATPTPTPTLTVTSTPTLTATPTATPADTSTPTPTPIPVHAAVQRVKAFHEAINAIEPGKETEEGKVDISKGLKVLGDIFGEHTTRPAGLPTISTLIVAMGSGMVRFSNMEYELVSESAECTVVSAAGEIAIGEETGALDEEYVVVKREEKWLIKLNAKSCD